MQELNNFSETKECQYIAAFNNINKHQYTIEVQSALALNNGKIEAAYVHHFFQSKKLQFGFGEDEIIQNPKSSNDYKGKVTRS